VHREGLRSAGVEDAEEVGFVQVVLEGFLAVDEDYGDFVVVAGDQGWVGVYVDLCQSEGGFCARAEEGLLDLVAEVAVGAGVEDYVHGAMADFRLRIAELRKFLEDAGFDDESG
jgi:hypothetical protein